MNLNERSGPSSELLRTFCAVAEAGNVTQAASALARTQSAISVQIRRLEDELAVSLFDRLARGVALTKDGQKLLPVARKALAEIERAGMLFASPLEGEIRIGIPDDYNDSILEPALAQFCSRHSGVEVFVRSGCTAGFPDAIARGELDLAVYSSGTLPSGDIFSTEPTVWAGSADFSLQHDAPVPLAVFDRNCWWRNLATDSLDKCQRSWRIAYLSENYTSIKAAIRAGLGIGTLTRSAVDDTMQILGDQEGLPNLPLTYRTLLRGSNVPKDLVQEMESAIVLAIG